jgi:DNA-binding NarL/FixJ family response regulator
MIREGLRLQLERRGVRCLGEAGSGREALALVGRLQPRVALIDTGLPRRSGIEVAAQIHSSHPAIGLIMLAGRPDYDDVVPAFKAGAQGYVCKGRPAGELEFAVKTVAEGLVFISPAVAGRLLEDYLAADTRPPSELERLTGRQRDLLQLIAQGATSKEIAAALNLSVRTAEKHRYLLMKRLSAHSTADLVLFAVRTGLVDVSGSIRNGRGIS